jgi:hypothetical protein
MQIKDILLSLAIGTLNIVCFLIGAKVGQTVSKGEPITLPEVNPMKAIQEKRERKAAEAEADKLQTILENIENYDGTGSGQKDVPRG